MRCQLAFILYCLALLLKIYLSRYPYIFCCFVFFYLFSLLLKIKDERKVFQLKTFIFWVWRLMLIQHIHIIQYLTQQHQNKLVYISYNYPSAVNKPQNTLIIINIDNLETERPRRLSHQNCDIRGQEDDLACRPGQQTRDKLWSLAGDILGLGVVFTVYKFVST